MLQKISSVFVVYRRKTLTGSPDPTHAIGEDKPCNDLGVVSLDSKDIFFNFGFFPSSIWMNF